jgi:hypothetical protein
MITFTRQITTILSKILFKLLIGKKPIKSTKLKPLPHILLATKDTPSVGCYL